MTSNYDCENNSFNQAVAEDNPDLVDTSGMDIDDSSEIVSDRTSFPNLDRTEQDREGAEGDTFDSQNNDEENSGPTDAEELNNLLKKLAPLAKLEDETVTKLVENLEALAKLTIKEDYKEKNKSDIETVEKSDDVASLLFACKNIPDVTSKFQEFEYDKEAEAVVCCVCSAQQTEKQAGVFKYKVEDDDDSELGSKQSTKFRSLKQHLKRHLISDTHKLSLEILTNKSKLQIKEDTRNQAVALRIGRIAYFLLKTGRPDTDFVSLLYLHSVNGADIGDLNHSAHFPAKFLRHVYSVI